MFASNFTIDDTRMDDDLALERDGATVLIDPVSLDFLKGAEIDFVDELAGVQVRRRPRVTDGEDRREIRSEDHVLHDGIEQQG